MSNDRIHTDFYDKYSRHKIDNHKRYLMSAFHRPNFYERISTLEKIREALVFVIGEKMHYILADCIQEPIKYANLVNSDTYRSYVESHLYYIANAQIDYRSLVNEWLTVNTDYGHLFENWYDKIIDFNGLKYHQQQNVKWIAFASKYEAQIYRGQVVDIVKKEDTRKLFNMFFNSEKYGEDFDLKNTNMYLRLLFQSDTNQGLNRLYNHFINKKVDHRLAEAITGCYRSAAYSVIKSFNDGEIKTLNLNDFNSRLDSLLEEKSFTPVKFFGVREALELWDIHNKVEKLNFMERVFNYERTTADEYRLDHNGFATNDKKLQDYRYFRRIENMFNQALKDNEQLNYLEENLIISLITNEIAQNASKYSKNIVVKAIEMNNVSHNILDSVESLYKRDNKMAERLFPVRSTITDLINNGMYTAKHLDLRNFNQNNKIYSYRQERVNFKKGVVL